MYEDGLYEQIVTQALADWLRTSDAAAFTAELSKLDPAESAQAIADHLQRVLAAILSRIPSKDRPAKQVALANALLAQASTVDPSVSKEALKPEGELLRALWKTPPLRDVTRPLTPLDQSALLVNAPREPKLAAELYSELESADKVDLLCAFVVWTGVRVLREPLKRLQERGVPLRILTTTYMGATQARALDLLQELGAEIRVNYETRATRLHAKAWLFERDSGFSTAYIGSSNLSHAALHDGLEWNVRISQRSEPLLMERFRAAFATYWEEERWEPYEPERFRKAVGAIRKADQVDFTLFDIRPYPYQERMLYQLEVERERHGRWRNLVVAATGTGKTVLAALDYKRVREKLGKARLLFVAHRKEILEQSLQTFRHVVRDGSFGELYVAGHKPDEWEHVFASIQSLTNDVLDRIPSDAFDVVIVDEFHHAKAPSYDRLLNHVSPKLLLGLTATPERADGKDVTEWFDGHTAVELRLWDAIDEGLLCPFQYFGVSDEVDLSSLEWKRGGYDLGQLDDIYTGNNARVTKVLAALDEIVIDTHAMRALGFCVSIKHAEFMADRFREAGIPALAVSGLTDAEERDAALRRLKDREVNVLFAVDLYNEGVDVPEIDTVLFLRPTESVTVFLQQLGRGLRKTESKPGLTVLDFIGQQHRRFRFDARFRALTGASRGQLEAQIKEDFPFLPSGCHIHLDRVARETVLDNVRQAVTLKKSVLAEELRALGDVSLSGFLEETGLALSDIYRAKGSWTALRRLAKLDVPAQGPKEEELLRGLPRLLHVDDAKRIDAYQEVLKDPDQKVESEWLKRALTMLHYSLWGKEGRSVSDSLNDLHSHPAVVEEVGQLLEIVEEKANHLTTSVDLPDVPLQVHAHYSVNEVLAAMGQSTVEKANPLREGVRFDDQHKTDLFFVTLNKSEKDYSPTTMYRDYAISPTLFHWESQSTTSEQSPTGQRYVNHKQRGSRIFLFVRLNKTTSTGAAPYLFLGPAEYVSHKGERPMAITWRLQHPIPPDFFQEARAVA
jgi:superfamily II DNA or RNA helicase